MTAIGAGGDVKRAPEGAMHGLDAPEAAGDGDVGHAPPRGLEQTARPFHSLGLHVGGGRHADLPRSEEHTSELQSQSNLVCRLLLEKKKKKRDSGYNERQKMKQGGSKR